MQDVVIFDSHVHLFTREVFAFYAKQSPELQAAADPAAAATERLGIELPPERPEALAEQWIKELDRHGVQRAVLFGSAPGEQSSVARAVRAYPGRFAGFQVLNPRAPHAASALDDIVTQGLRGILLFPAMHEFFPDDPICRPVLKAAQGHRLVVFIHIGFLKIAIREKLGVPGSFDERFGDPQRLVRVLREFADVTFIVPHFGCGLLGDLLSVSAEVRNLYLDTSGSNSWMARTPKLPDLDTVFGTVLEAEALGPERIIFGTDSTLFPHGWRQDVYQTQMEAVQRLKLSQRETQAILSRNLERILA